MQGASTSPLQAKAPGILLDLVAWYLAMLAVSALVGGGFALYEQPDTMGFGLVAFGLVAIVTAYDAAARHKRSRHGTLGSFGVWAAFFFVPGALNGDLSGAICQLMVLSPIVLIWAPFQPAPLRDEPTPQTHRVGRTFLRNVALLCGGLVFLAFILVEVGRVKAMFLEHRLQAKCEEEDAQHSCAHAALLRLRWAETIEHARSAADQFRDVCDEDRNGLACTWWAHVQSDYMLAAVGDAESVLHRYRNGHLRQQCDEGTTEACWALAQIDEGTRLDLDLIASSCDRGETLACELLASRSPSNPDNREKACSLGWQKHCPAVALADRMRCAAGDAPACIDAAEQTNEPLEKAVYVAMGDGAMQAVDISGFIGVEIDAEPDALHRACAEGEATACLGAGLSIVAPEESRSWRPELPDRSRLDATFGRACELGMDAACLAYAVRLLDHVDPPGEHVARANELANVACERGNYRGCWLRDYRDEIVEGNYASLRDSARQTCMALPPDSPHTACRTYANLLAHELDASFTPMDDRVYFALIGDFCHELQAPASCRRVAQMLMSARGPGIGFRRMAYDSAAWTCAQHDGWGCQTLIDIPRVFAPTPATSEELRASICDKVGFFCPTK